MTQIASKVIDTKRVVWYYVYNEMTHNASQRKEIVKMREWLRNVRKAKNMTQQEVADKLELSRQYYAMIEKGERQMPLDMQLASKISRLFDITLDQIVDYDCIKL